MSGKGWQKDGSGLDVYRCRGKTYCPRGHRSERGRKRLSYWSRFPGGAEVKAIWNGPADKAKLGIGDRMELGIAKKTRKLIGSLGRSTEGLSRRDPRYHLRKTKDGRAPKERTVSEQVTTLVARASG